ncbi:MAG TPA: tyrosine-type recombinase/integrase [bacterium]|jgi:site-specific recombinase XerD
MRLRAFARDYLEYSRATKALKTCQADASALKDFTRVVGNLEVKAIRREHFEQFRLVRLQQIKPTSVNIALRHLRAAFSWAADRGYVSINPATRVKLNRVPHDLHPRFLSASEIERLRGAAQQDAPLLNAINVALWTGMRRNELVNLRWADVDLNRRVITVQCYGNYRTKSGKSRMIPLNDALHALLTGILPENVSREDHVISLRYGTLARRFRQAVKRAGLDGGVSLHVLRHTFASHLAMAGVDLRSIQAILGHSDISITMIYSHLSPEHLARTVERLPY